MKKQNKKEWQDQVKSWKVWFYTLLLPMIIFLLCVAIQLRVDNWSYTTCDSSHASLFSTPCTHLVGTFIPLRNIFYIVFCGYYLLYLVICFFIKNKYFSWKIFLGLLLFALIDSFFFYGYETEEIEDTFKISEEGLGSN